MEIAVLLYPDFVALDAVGPCDVLRHLPGAVIRTVAAEPGPVRSDRGPALLAEAACREVLNPDILIVPGGIGSRRMERDETVLSWIRTVHERTKWTTSVCTGGLILAAAGMLKGLRATTHWMQLERLRAYGAEPVSERVVFEGKIVTSAGVSAGIDMALHLVRKIAGDQTAQIIQLGMEYDPQPPFDSGSPSKAPPELVAFLKKVSEEREEAQAQALEKKPD